jgi:hypothetical protein
MDINLATSVLVDPATKALLRALASRKRAKFGDLVTMLKAEQLLGSDDEALSSLGKLKDLHLVEERGAVLPRWNEYYVTADGLEANRKLLEK